MRHKKVKRLAQGHTADNRRSRDSNPSAQTPEPVFLSNKEATRPLVLMGLGEEEPTINQATSDEITPGDDSKWLSHPYLSEEALWGALEGSEDEMETGHP